MLPSGGMEAGSLTRPQQETLRNVVRALVDYCTIGRARQIAQESKLVGSRNDRLDPAQLKRLLPDADRLAAELGSAFVDAGRRRAAAHTLSRLGDEAFRSAKLPANVGEVFRRARSAVEQSDWERASSRLLQLQRVATDSGDKAIAATAEVVLVCGLGRTDQLPLARLQAVLLPQAVLRPITARPIEQTVPSKPPPPDERPPTTPPAVGPLPGEAAPALVEAPTPIHAPSETTTTGSGPATAPAHITLPAVSWGQHLDAFDELVEPALAGARQELDQVERSDAPRLAAVLNLRAAHERLRLMTVVEPVSSDANGPLRDSAVALQLAWDDLARAERVALRASEHARAAVEALCGSGAAADTAGLEAAADGARAALSALRSVRERAPAEAVWSEAAPTNLSELAREAERLYSTLFARVAALDAPSLVPPLHMPATQIGFTSALSVPKPENKYFRLFLNTARFEAATGYLPLDARSPPREARLSPADATPAATLDVLAHNLLRYWCGTALDVSLPPSRLLHLLSDAGGILRVAAEKEEAAHWGNVSVGLALDAACEDRPFGPGRRRRSELLTATTAAQAADVALEIAAVAAAAPATPSACAALIQNGFGDTLASIAARLPVAGPLAARAMGDCLATAFAGLGWSELVANMVRALTVALGESHAAVVEALDFIEDSLRTSTRSAPLPVPHTLRARLARDVVERTAERLRQSSGSASARINVTVPVGEVLAEAGRDRLEIPLLITNRGDAGAAGVEIVVQRPVDSKGPMQKDSYTEKHLAWLPRKSMEESSEMIAAEISTDEIDPSLHTEVRLAIRATWMGHPQPEPSSALVRLVHTRPNIAFRPIDGASGEPVDLNDASAFGSSSRRVRETFATLRDRLSRKEPVRAVVYGRRRRGKSSISRSLALNAEVNASWIVVRDSLSSAPLRSLAEALSRLTDVLGTAFRRVDITVPVPVYRPGEPNAALASTYANWMQDCARSTSRPTRVLLLLDEFQRWLSALDHGARLTVLGLLRDFNERAYGEITVAFVLSGLRNLADLIDASADFKNATDRREIPAFTREETLAYLRDRLDPQLDERSRLRLHRMSGGNPYLLNRLGLLLQQTIAELGRSWATVLDIERLFDRDSGDTRIDDYVQYMLREDEEDSAATLKQLSVLRAAASILDRSRDYEGAVSVSEIEGWLAQRHVQFEAGVTAEHLRQLTVLGALDTADHERFSLPGEWLCRRLASLTTDLLPVTHGAGADLVLRRYQKLQNLGVGGQSNVWLGRNIEEGGHDVVLKIYTDAVGTEAEMDERVRREEALLTAIRHEGVVKCLGRGVDARYGGVVILEYVDGPSLEDVVQRSAEHPEFAALAPGGDERTKIDFLVLVADALAECHRQRIVHKDVSPRNILVVARLGTAVPVLIDFGLAAREGDSDAAPIGTSQWMSPAYCAPEKLRGMPRTRASDVWSLGATFLSSFSGRSPSPGEPLLDHVARPEWRVPSRIQALVREMLDPAVSKRPNAAEVRDRLAAARDPVPRTWTEFTDVGEGAFLEGRIEDAADALKSALHLARDATPTERRLADLVRTSIDVATDEAVPGPWYPRWFDEAWRSMALAMSRGVVLENEALERLIAKFARVSDTDGRERVWQTMIDVLVEHRTGVVMAQTMRVLMGRVRDIPDKLALPTYEAMLAAVEASVIGRDLLQAFCVARAQLALERQTSLEECDGWLRRARYVGGTPSAEQVSLRARFDDIYRKTSNAPVLPLDCRDDDYVGVATGADEQGHTNVDRLGAFAKQLRSRHPFVVGVERVNLHRRGGTVRRPTLLPLTSALGLRASGRTDDFVACLLDDQFVRGTTGPLLVRILLHKESTPKHREAAFRELVRDVDLFDARGSSEP